MERSVKGTLGLISYLSLIFLLLKLRYFLQAIICIIEQGRVYDTFQQIRANGGKVRKGEKATVVVFWKSSVQTDEVKNILGTYWGT